MTREENRARWAEQVRAQGASGKSITAFCREHGINSKTFFRWAKILGSRGVVLTAGSKHKLPRFARVEVVRPAESVAVSVRLPGGVAIESDGFPDPIWVSAVISGLVEEGFR